MSHLTEEATRIKSELADICCKTVSGKTCKELVEEIIYKILSEKSSF